MILKVLVGYKFLHPTSTRPNVISIITKTTKDMSSYGMALNAIDGNVRTIQRAGYHYESMTEDTLTESSNHWKWLKACRFMKLSEAFIEKHVDRIDWYWISRQ